MKARFSFVVATALSSVSSAAQVHVPGDFATLQAAIDNSPAGTTILVHGGTHPNIVVDKPLQLVGDPQFEIKGWGWDASFHGFPGIALSGPGHGTVMVARAKLSNFAFTSTYASAAPAIAGGGFDQLQILHCDVRGADGCCDESINGGAGLDVTVPYVVISDSLVVGGSNNHDDLFGMGFGLPAGIGVDAPQSTVLLIDSTIRGGTVPDTGFADAAGPCPSCAQILAGEGAIGIVAQRLFVAGSVVTGGGGGSFSCFDTTTQQVTPICDKPDGAAVVANQQVALGGYLLASGPVDVGGTWTLTWFVGSGPALLLVAPTLIAPAKVGGTWLFLDPASVLALGIPAGGLFSSSLVVPAIPALAGLTIGAQTYDTASGLSRPTVSAIVP